MHTERSTGPTGEVIGIDHIYVTVSDLARSEAFYDKMFAVIGFRKNSFALNGEQHIQYYNRLFGYVLRPARHLTDFDSYAPGLHHLCLRVTSTEEVIKVARALQDNGIEASVPRLYPEYAPDYTATFFTDPDGLRLEVTNYRTERKDRHEHWEQQTDPLLQTLTGPESIA